MAEIWISFLCSQPIKEKDSAMQASTKVKSSVESPFSKLEISYCGKYRYDLHKDDFEKRKLKKQRWSIQGNLKQKVVALFHRSKVSERDRQSDMMENPRKSDLYMEDDESVLTMPRPKLRSYFEGLSDSSSQTEMWGSHSVRTQTEPLSLAHMPENL